MISEIEMLKNYKKNCECSICINVIQKIDYLKQYVVISFIKIVLKNGTKSNMSNM